VSQNATTSALPLIPIAISPLLDRCVFHSRSPAENDVHLAQDPRRARLEGIGSSMMEVGSGADEVRSFLSFLVHFLRGDGGRMVSGWRR
jgi:hypothetical protein